MGNRGVENRAPVRGQPWLRKMDEIHLRDILHQQENPSDMKSRPRHLQQKIPLLNPSKRTFSSKTPENIVDFPFLLSSL